MSYPDLDPVGSRCFGLIRFSEKFDPDFKKIESGSGMNI